MWRGGEDEVGVRKIRLARGGEKGWRMEWQRSGEGESERVSEWRCEVVHRWRRGCGLVVVWRGGESEEWSVGALLIGSRCDVLRESVSSVRRG